MSLQFTFLLPVTKAKPPQCSIEPLLSLDNPMSHTHAYICTYSLKSIKKLFSALWVYIHRRSLNLQCLSGISELVGLKENWCSLLKIQSFSFKEYREQQFHGTQLYTPRNLGHLWSQLVNPTCFIHTNPIKNGFSPLSSGIIHFHLCQRPSIAFDRSPNSGSNLCPTVVPVILSHFCSSLFL
jgi:hypothetical protein